MNKSANAATRPGPRKEPGTTPRGRMAIVVLCALMAILAWVGSVSAQRWNTRDGESIEISGSPQWQNPPAFTTDVFTFARVEYDSGAGDFGYFGTKWRIDYPDADLNLAYRLREITSMAVDPQGVTLRLTDDALQDYPFIYMVEPGDILLSSEETEALRNYLLNGGFMMVDDFWGDSEWQPFARAMGKVFPDRPIIDLDLNHEIFNTVFPLSETLDELPQIPNAGQGQESQYTGVTWEPRKGPSARDVHYRAILDDEDRIMVMICHNTDLGDGWEREGEYQYFFREFSEKKAYPLGINIIFYAMTH